MSIHAKDVELVSGILAGRDDAFEHFFQTCYPRLFRFALRRLGGNRAAAEDVAQATIVRAIGALSGYRGEASLLAWIFTLCRRELAAGWRGALIENRLIRIEDQEQARAALESLAGEAELEPDQEAGRLEREQIVQTALDYLPEDYATALEGKYLRDESVQQIAARLGRSAKATESLLTRAREMFREAVTELYGADAALQLLK